jgi:hypothetical protein
MADDTSSSNALANGGQRPNPFNQPRPTPSPSVAPGKVQGGYQAPIGEKPAAPTIGSGVKR